MHFLLHDTQVTDKALGPLVLNRTPILQNVWLVCWLFIVLRPAQEIFTYMGMSPLSVMGCKITMLGDFLESKKLKLAKLAKLEKSMCAKPSRGCHHYL
jgi:hypothetical protein